MLSDYGKGFSVKQSEEEAIFFMQIGLATTAWADVENALRYVALACIENDPDDMNHRVVQLGYFSIEAFRSKLEFVNAVVSRKFAGSAKLNDWMPLVERVRTASQQRNKIAHRSFNLYLQSRPGRRIALVPWKITKRKTKPNIERAPDGSLCLRDIFKLTQEFIAVRATLENFCAWLQGKNPPNAVDEETAGDPPSLSALRRAFYEVLSKP